MSEEEQKETPIDPRVQELLNEASALRSVTEDAKHRLAVIGEELDAVWPAKHGWLYINGQKVKAEVKRTSRRVYDLPAIHEHYPILWEAITEPKIITAKFDHELRAGHITPEMARDIVTFEEGAPYVSITVVKEKEAAE